MVFKQNNPGYPSSLLFCSPSSAPCSAVTDRLAQLVLLMGATFNDLTGWGYGAYNYGAYYQFCPEDLANTTTPCTPERALPGLTAGYANIVASNGTLYVLDPNYYFAIPFTTPHASRSIDPPAKLSREYAALSVSPTTGRPVVASLNVNELLVCTLDPSLQSSGCLTSVTITLPYATCAGRSGGGNSFGFPSIAAGTSKIYVSSSCDNSMYLVVCADTLSLVACTVVMPWRTVPELTSSYMKLEVYSDQDKVALATSFKDASGLSGMGLLFTSTLPCKVPSHAMVANGTGFTASVVDFEWRATAECFPGFSPRSSAVSEYAVCDPLSAMWTPPLDNLCVFNISTWSLLEGPSGPVDAGTGFVVYVGDLSKPFSRGPGPLRVTVAAPNGTLVSSHPDFERTTGIAGVWNLQVSVVTNIRGTYAYQILINNVLSQYLSVEVKANLSPTFCAGKILLDESPVLLYTSTTTEWNMTLVDKFGNQMCGSFSSCDDCFDEIGDDFKIESSLPANLGGSVVSFIPGSGGSGEVICLAVVELTTQSAPSVSAEKLWVEYRDFHVPFSYSVVIQVPPSPPPLPFPSPPPPLHCLPGHFRPISKSVCLPCPPGEYSENGDRTECSPCPSGSTTWTNGSSAISDCSCVPGMYRLSMEDPSDGCHACPLGGKCPGHLVAPYALPGWYNSSSARYFLKCPGEGALPDKRCIGNSHCGIGYDRRLCSRCSNGYFAEDSGVCARCHENGPAPLVLFLLVLATFLAMLFWLLLAGDNPSIALMRKDRSSRSSWLRRSAHLCIVLWKEAFLVLIEVAALALMAVMGLRETSEVFIIGCGLFVLSAYLCLARIRGYQQALRNMQETSGARESSVGFISVASATDSLLFSSTGQGMLEEVEVEEVVVHIESLIKVLVVHFQVLAAITSLFDGEWTAAVAGAKTVLEKLNVQVASLSCNGLSFSGRFYFAISLCPGVLAILAAVTAARWIILRTPASREHLVVTSLKMGVGIIYFFLFPIVSQSFSMYACLPERIPDPPSSYLVSAPWIKCGSPEHRSLLVVATLVVVALLAVSFGIGAQVRAHHPSVAFLRDAFVDRAWWYEGFKLVWRIVVALFISAIPTKSSILPVLVVSVLLLAMSISTQILPYHSLSLSRLELSSFCVLILSVVVVDHMSDVNSSHSSIVGLASIFLAANISFLLGVVYLSLSPFLVLFHSSPSIPSSRHSVQ